MAIYLPVKCLQHGNQYQLEHMESCHRPTDHTRTERERKSGQPIERIQKKIYKLYQYDDIHNFQIIIFNIYLIYRYKNHHRIENLNLIC